VTGCSPGILPPNLHALRDVQPDMDDLLRDFRFALRGLLRTPGFTLVAVATLALGIGANSAIFSVVDHVLLRPLAYARSERLVAVFEHDVRRGAERSPHAMRRLTRAVCCLLISYGAITLVGLAV